MEYRIKLDGGDILVVTLEVETAEDVLSEANPENIGVALLNALGIGRTSVKTASVKAERKRTPPPADENPDTWLRKSSERSLGTKFKRNTRADGDTGD